MHIYGIGVDMKPEDEEEISKIVTAGVDGYSNIHENTTNDDRYDVMTRIKRAVCDGRCQPDNH